MQEKSESKMDYQKSILDQTMDYQKSILYQTMDYQVHLRSNFNQFQSVETTGLVKFQMFIEKLTLIRLYYHLFI